MGRKEAITGFFNFLNFFTIFFELSLMRRIETKRNETIIFIYSLVQRFPICFGLKCVHNCFFEFFSIFFGIFYYASGGNETERQFLFSLFPGLLQPILAWKEAIMVFFNFLNFFAIFLEFSMTLWVGTKRNDNFYFLNSLAFSNLFCLEMMP